MDNKIFSKNFTTNDHINISEYYEAEYWAKKFGVTVEQLKSAIRAVGNSVIAVEKRLKKQLA
jgi:translation initiation factor 6 (eIF-6)